MNINTNSTIKYFLYARRSVEKSDKEDKVASIESQLSEMKDLAKRQGLKIVGIFQEAKSAKEPYVRVEFQKMIQQIQAGKADGVLCWKMDRLARNPVDEGTIKYLLQKGIIKNIKASDRDWYPDDNVLLASVEFGVATQYSRDLAKHIKRGLKAKVEGGHRPSIACIGYKNSRYHEKGKEEILVDEERFPLVRQLFDKMLTGTFSPLSIVKVADDIGLTMKWPRSPKYKKISKSNIYRIFTNPFYYGDFEYPEGSGNWYHGLHKPMITKEEYDKVQFLLGREGKPRPKSHVFAFTGLMKCGECGASITAEEKWKHQKNGNVHHYIYYHCTKRVNANCTQKAINEEELNAQILEFLKKVEVPNLFHQWAMEVLKKMHDEEKFSRNNVLNIKQRHYEEVVNKLDMLLELRMAGEVSAEDYQAKKSDLERQKTELKAALDSTDQRVDNWLQSAEKAMSFAERARRVFEKGNVEAKRGILANLGYNHLLKDRILNIQAEKPLLIIGEAAKVAKSISDRLEPPKTLAMQRQIRQKYEESSLMWRWRESNSRAKGEM